mmetsp:Transcript_5702/g.15226  ORF Transcript_5702/g.15226 Transcript_5702/m.15226 type:complete len:148 (+) Transcript_5702:48-491(+)
MSDSAGCTLPISPEMMKQSSRARTEVARRTPTTSLRKERSITLEPLELEEPSSSRCAVLSFQRQRARTLPPRAYGRRPQQICIDEPDPLTLRKLRDMVDTGRALSSSAEVLSPTALQDILTVSRRNSKALKDRLPVILEAPDERALE